MAKIKYDNLQKLQAKIKEIENALGSTEKDVAEKAARELPALQKRFENALQKINPLQTQAQPELSPEEMALYRERLGRYITNKNRVATGNYGQGADVVFPFGADAPEGYKLGGLDKLQRKYHYDKALFGTMNPMFVEPFMPRAAKAIELANDTITQFGRDRVLPIIRNFEAERQINEIEKNLKKSPPAVKGASTYQKKQPTVLQNIENSLMQGGANLQQGIQRALTVPQAEAAMRTTPDLAPPPQIPSAQVAPSMNTPANVQSWNDFVNVATQVAQRENFPVQVLLGQAAVETGRKIENAPGNNWFGIKGQGTVGSNNLPTQEQGANGLYNTSGNFAAFNSPEESVRAYINLIKTRYPKAWALRDNPVAMVQAIKAGGYASDDKYVNSVINTPEFRGTTPSVLSARTSYVAPKPQQFNMPNLMPQAYATERTVAKAPPISDQITQLQQQQTQLRKPVMPQPVPQPKPVVQPKPVQSFEKTLSQLPRQVNTQFIQPTVNYLQDAISRLFGKK